MDKPRAIGIAKVPLGVFCALLASHVAGCPTPTPRIEPRSGTYSCPLSATLSDPSERATMYYTTDGSRPTVDSSKYTVPISITGTGTLRAIAIAPGAAHSKVASATYHCESASLTRREFAVLVQQAFPLPPPSQPINFPDVPRSDPAYQAIQTVASFMNSQVLCPGCLLNPNFFPDQPVTRAISIITLLRILQASHRLKLLSASDSEDVLSIVPDASELTVASHPLFATAIRFGILTLNSENKIHGSDGHTKTEMVSLLDKMRRQFNLANTNEQ